MTLDDMQALIADLEAATAGSRELAEALTALENMEPEDGH